MSALEKLQIGNVVSFDTHAPAILGSNFKELKVTGIFDKDTASVYGIDINSKHANIYPFLPEGSPNDPDDYQYVKLKANNGNSIILGIPWINENTISIINKGKLVITINDVTVEDKDKILTSIAAIGYRVNKITLD